MRSYIILYNALPIFVHHSKIVLRTRIPLNSSEPIPSCCIRIVSSRVNQSATERVFLATYPAMQKVYQSFDVGFFDLIIADESHRSIYNVYGDMFHYFDWSYRLKLVTA